ncbi:MAG: LLM class F420-dependent oxidoreductase [Actinomycetota bacterium]|nr:MAG: LLM class F420-dependent oxidoreductase [Actinomycetota bacterium]
MTRDLRLGLLLDHAAPDPATFVRLARHVEGLGYHSVWTYEAYGSDSVVPLTWIAAHTERIKLGTGIMQIPARTPAMTAMTAMTLDTFSDGRAILGLGLSGPQVAEGWHGQPYSAPLARTREYVAAVRQVMARETPLQLDGEVYQIPYRGPGSTGLGKPLRSILPARSVPIYLAALGPRNVSLATDIADGWLPLFFSPTRWSSAFGEILADVDLATFDVAAVVKVVLDDDVARARDTIRPWVALYVGGMGARGRNFYHDLAARFGFAADADAIQDLYLDGRRAEAIAAVPDALIDEIALVGPRSRIAERIHAWRESPVTTLIASTSDEAALAVLAESLG